MKIFKKLLNRNTKKKILIQILNELKHLNENFDKVIGHGENSRNTPKYHIRTGNWENNRY